MLKEGSFCCWLLGVRAFDLAERPDRDDLPLCLPEFGRGLRADLLDAMWLFGMDKIDVVRLVGTPASFF